MRISDWTSDVCSSDLLAEVTGKLSEARERLTAAADVLRRVLVSAPVTGTVVQLKVHTRSEERRVGKECVIRVDLGGRCIIKHNNHTHQEPHNNIITD